MATPTGTVLLVDSLTSISKSFKDLALERWQEKTDACPAQTPEGWCSISDKECAYTNCFGLYWRR